MRSSSRKFIPLLVGVLLLVTDFSHARVFSRWGGGAFGSSWGWEPAYETEMLINQGKSDVKVYGTASSQAQVLKQLEAYYTEHNATHFFYPGQAMGWGIALHQGKVDRFLVTSPDPGYTSVVYKISQSESEYFKARPDYQRHRLTEVPVFPGSRPAYFNEDTATRAVLEVSHTGAQPQVVFMHLDRALRDAGWITALPATGEMRVYQKGQDLAAVQVSASSGGQAVVTRFFKRGAANRKF